MQFTSDSSVNSLITLLVVILIACICGRSWRRGGRGGYVISGGIGIPGVSGGGAVNKLTSKPVNNRNELGTRIVDCEDD